MPYLDKIDWVNDPPVLSSQDDEFLSARTAMLSAATDFLASLDLFGHARSKMNCCEVNDRRHRDRYFKWMAISSKDGVLNIYHFGVALKALSGHLKALQRSESDIVDAQLALQVFGSCFPHSVRMRNAVGHFSETVSSRISFDQHKLRRDVIDDEGVVQSERGTIVASIEEDRFSLTHKGELLSMEMSAKSFAGMRQILMTIAPSTTKKVLPQPALI